MNRLAELSAALGAAINEFVEHEYEAIDAASDWQAELWASRIAGLQDCAAIVAALP